jgi:hypothetical protein
MLAAAAAWGRCGDSVGGKAVRDARGGRLDGKEPEVGSGSGGGRGVPVSHRVAVLRPLWHA